MGTFDGSTIVNIAGGTNTVGEATITGESANTVTTATITGGVSSLLAPSTVSGGTVTVTEATDVSGGTITVEAATTVSGAVAEISGAVADVSGAVSTVTSATTVSGAVANIENSEVTNIIGVEEALEDGKSYARKDGAWAEIVTPTPTLCLVEALPCVAHGPVGTPDVKMAYTDAVPGSFTLGESSVTLTLGALDGGAPSTGASPITFQYSAGLKTDVAAGDSLIMAYVDHRGESKVRDFAPDILLAGAGAGAVNFEAPVASIVSFTYTKSTGVIGADCTVYATLKSDWNCYIAPACTSTAIVGISRAVYLNSGAGDFGSLPPPEMAAATLVGGMVKVSGNGPARFDANTGMAYGDGGTVFLTLRGTPYAYPDAPA